MVGHLLSIQLPLSHHLEHHCGFQLSLRSQLLSYQKHQTICMICNLYFFNLFLKDVVSGTVVATDSLLQVLGLHQELSEIECIQDDSEISQSSQKGVKKNDSQEKMWEILNRIPTSTAQDTTTISSTEGSSAIYLPKPGEPGKYILVMGEQNQISLLEQSNLNPKVSLGPKKPVPEIILDCENLKISVNSSDFVPKIKVEDSDDIQVIGERKQANIYGYMQSTTPSVQKKKPGRPKKPKIQVEPPSFIDEETTDSQRNSLQDIEPVSGKRRRGKLPSRWNDYIVENFDEAITSGGKNKLGKFSESEMDLSGDSNFEEDLNAFEEEDDDDDISLDGTPRRAKSGVPKLPRPMVIPVGGEVPQNISFGEGGMWRFTSSKKRGRPRKFETQRHIIVPNSVPNLLTPPANPEIRRRTLTVTPIFNTDTVLSRPTPPPPEAGMKTLITAGGEKILVPESGDENSMPTDDATGSGTSGLHDININYRELIQDPNFSPLKKSAPRKTYSFTSDMLHRMPSTRGRGGAHSLKRRPGRPRKEDQLSRLTNGGILGTTLSELMTRKSSIVSRKIKEEREVKKNRVFVVMQDGTMVEVSGSDRQKAVLKATAKVEAIRRSVGRIREIEKAKYMDDDDDDYDDPKKPGARYAYAVSYFHVYLVIIEFCLLLYVLCLAKLYKRIMSSLFFCFLKIMQIVEVR